MHPTLTAMPAVQSLMHDKRGLVPEIEGLDPVFFEAARLVRGNLLARLQAWFGRYSGQRAMIAGEPANLRFSAD